MPKKTALLLKFGERVRDIRKELNISQETLAFKADMKQKNFVIV